MANAGIQTAEDLAEKSASEMMRYWGFGERCLFEVRHKLAEVGLHLKGEEIPQVMPCVGELDELKARKHSLMLELEEVKERISQIKKAHRVREEFNDDVPAMDIFRTWTTCWDFAKVGRELNVSRRRVYEGCWEGVVQEILQGRQPQLERAVERYIQCRSCGRKLRSVIKKVILPTKCPRCSATFSEYVSLNSLDAKRGEKGLASPKLSIPASSSGPIA